MHGRDRLPLAIGLDVFAIVLFVAIGRRNHDESGTVAAVVETALPFLLGLVVAWLVSRAATRPTAVRTGVALWPVTVLVGMLLRDLVFDRGTAAPFVVVATVFVGACLVGWRAVLRLIDRRQSSGALTAR